MPLTRARVGWRLTWAEDWAPIAEAEPGECEEAAAGAGEPCGARRTGSDAVGAKLRQPCLLLTGGRGSGAGHTAAAAGKAAADAAPAACEDGREE